MGKLRVVLDTNVVLSALVFNGPVFQTIRHAWRNTICVPVISQTTTAELLRVLHYPRFHLDETQREELLADYLPYCEIVRVDREPNGVPDCRDPNDRPFLELMIVAKPDLLVSGDKDLLDLGSVKDSPILSVAEFVRHIEQ